MIRYRWALPAALAFSWTCLLAAQTSTVPYSESFESVWSGGAPSGWTSEYVSLSVPWSRETGGWLGHPGSAHSGSYNARFFYEGYDGPVTRMVSPVLNFGSLRRNARLVFEHAMEVWGPDQDTLSIYCKTSPSASWLMLTNFTNSAASWTQRTVPLPNPGNGYRICFEGAANFGFGVCVDDVQVLADPVVRDDFDGDGRSDMAVYWPGGGNWYVRNSGGGTTNRQFGWSEAVPVPADYDGDNKSDMAVYWPGGGNWYVRYSGGGTTNRQFGWSEAVPVAADYDGDNKTDMAVYWPGGGNWYVKYSGGGTTNLQFGWSEAVPVPADYDGDGSSDIAVYWPGGGNWYIRYSGGGSTNHQFGWAAAVPVPGDYDGDGKSDIAVYWPGGGNWYVKYSGGGTTNRQFGWSEAVPVPADYDGDGSADIAVYWPGGGNWYVKYSGGGTTNRQFGWSEAVPVLLQYQVNKRMGLLP